MTKEIRRIWRDICCILILLMLFCTLQVSGEENLSTYEGSTLENQTLHSQVDSLSEDRGENTLQNLLASFILEDRPHLEGSENISNASVTPEQTGERETSPTGPPHGMPVLEIGSAYIIFLLTFGLSVLVLALLSRAGQGLSAAYAIECRRVVSRLLAAGYILLGLVAGFVSIPVLSIFSASIITGDQFWLGGGVAFAMVYLVLSSFYLAYAVFNRNPLVLVQAAHPLPAIALMVISSLMGSMPQFTGKELIFPFILILSVALPLIHWRCLKQCPGDTGKEKPQRSPSSPTLMSGETSPSVRVVNGFPSELEERYGDAELVGRGGMALVFRARRRSDQEMVAVKVPTRYDEVTGHCFMKEMQIWKQLRHKNIVEVYTYNILPVPFVEMEFVGPSLAEKKMPVSVGEAVSIVRDIAEGLAYAHAAGLIHRDIKPGNILIAPDGTPKITDWGLGKEVADRKETRFVAFSMDYAAPEQISPNTYGRADARTDIFQLGVVFYELLTGRLPFNGDGMGEMSVAILTDAPLAPSRIMENLGAFDAIVLKCLEKTPENRYQSIEDLLSDLDALPAGSF